MLTSWPFRSRFRVLIICLICCLLLTILLSLNPIGTNVNAIDCKCTPDGQLRSDQTKSGERSAHKLAVVVPFRDRFDELLRFVPHMQDFLTKQGILHKIYVVNQRDVYRFNRASLINIGFLISRSECDYMAMHDVDLLPLNPNLTYTYPESGPLHLAAPDLHPKYHYKTFVGGILLITRDHFEKVNGLSNNYWGWGLEDDEFYARLRDANLEISRPEGITSGINDTFVHIHRPNHKRDTVKLFNQKEVTRRRDRKTGVNSVQFKLVGVNRVAIEGVSFDVYNVQLMCDLSSTPWCQIKQTSTRKPSLRQNG